MITIEQSYTMFAYGIGIGILLTAAWHTLAMIIGWLYKILN